MDKCYCGETALTICPGCNRQTYCPNCRECLVCSHKEKKEINLTIRIDQKMSEAIDAAVNHVRRAVSHSLTKSDIIRELIDAGITNLYSGNIPKLLPPDRVKTARGQFPNPERRKP